MLTGSSHRLCARYRGHCHDEIVWEECDPLAFTIGLFCIGFLTVISIAWDGVILPPSSPPEFCSKNTISNQLRHVCDVTCIKTYPFTASYVYMVIFTKDIPVGLAAASGI